MDNKDDNVSSESSDEVIVDYWPTAKVVDGKVETYFDSGLFPPNGFTDENFEETDKLIDGLVEETLWYVREEPLRADELLSVMTDAAKFLPYNVGNDASQFAQYFLSGLAYEIAGLWDVVRNPEVDAL